MLQDSNLIPSMCTPVFAMINATAVPSAGFSVSFVRDSILLQANTKDWQVTSLWDS